MIVDMRLVVSKRKTKMCSHTLLTMYDEDARTLPRRLRSVEYSSGLKQPRVDTFMGLGRTLGI